VEAAPGGARKLGVPPVLVESDEEARTQRFIGSPTIRVEGNDVELAVADRTEFAVACRVYDTPTGKRGLLAVDVVRAALGALW
jgi:hypothetical protein